MIWVNAHVIYDIYIYMYLYNYIYILSLSFISAFPLHPQTSHQGPLRQRDFCRITTVWGVWDAFGSVPHRLFASFPGCFPSFHWQEHSPTRSLRNIGRLEIPNWRSSTTSWNSFLSTGRLWPPLSVKKSKKSPSSWAYTINHDQEAYHKSYIIIDNPKIETHFGPKI